MSKTYSMTQICLTNPPKNPKTYLNLGNSINWVSSHYSYQVYVHTNIQLQIDNSTPLVSGRNRIIILWIPKFIPNINWRLRTLSGLGNVHCTTRKCLTVWWRTEGTRTHYCCYWFSPSLILLLFKKKKKKKEKGLNPISCLGNGIEKVLLWSCWCLRWTVVAAPTKGALMRSPIVVPSLSPVKFFKC